MDKKIIDTNITKAKNWTSCLSLDDDVLLIDRLSDAPFPRDPRRMNFILICMCIKGGVSYTLDTVRQSLTPGDLLVVSEHHVLDKYTATPDFEGLCMMVSMPFYNEIIRNVSDVSALFLFSHDHPIFPLSQRDQQTFSDYFYLIRAKIAETDNHYRRNLVLSLMMAMLYDLSNVVYHTRQQPVDIRQSRADTIFSRFIRLVEENCRRERRVGWYAHQLGITPKYLSETVKQVSMRTPNEWINNYVTVEIRVMLKTTTKNIKEIAHEMNFPNQSFLGKYFKEHVGMSPTTYRRS